MAGYKARNCRPQPGYPMSTAQGIKSRPAGCSSDCQQGRTCDCTDKPARLDGLGFAQIFLGVYAVLALAYFFAS